MSDANHRSILNNDRLTNNKPVLGESLGIKLSVLGVSFIVMLFIVSALHNVLSAFITEPRTKILVVSALQAIFVFIIPAILCGWCCNKKPFSYMGISTKISSKEIIYVIILMMISIPFLNMVIDWNANVVLPDALNNFQEVMREMEDNAAELTKTILSDTSVSGLVSGILIIGCLTGLAEEMFFRAGIQKAFTSSGMNRDFAVWSVAFIFSAVHFQFFGFVPRLLLGALFGYIYYSSRSVWLSAIAHAFNNSIVVIVSWLSARGICNVNPDTIGIEGGLFSWPVILSFIFFLILIIAGWRKVFDNSDSQIFKKYRTLNKTK